MASKKAPEINSGSMADIAFLLLIFFLVATTMEKDEGQKNMLPKDQDIEIDDVQPPPTIIPQRNLLEVRTNAKDQLFVLKRNRKGELIGEGDFSEITTGEYTEFIKEFYANTLEKDDKNWPVMRQWSIGKVADEKVTLLEGFKGDTTNYFYKKRLAKLDANLKTIEVTGLTDFVKPANTAQIIVTINANTSYGLQYRLEVLLKGLVVDLRNAKGMELFGMTYKQMKTYTDGSRDDQIKALETLIPDAYTIIKKYDI